MLAFLLIPVFCLGVGVAVGLLAARLARRMSALRAPLLRIPALAIAVVVIVQGASFGLEALRYDGGCSGWGERGSHPCTRLEFVLQDWELGLLFTAIPTLTATALALVAFSRSARRLPA